MLLLVPAAAAAAPPTTAKAALAPAIPSWAAQRPPLVSVTCSCAGCAGNACVCPCSSCAGCTTCQCTSDCCAAYNDDCATCYAGSTCDGKCYWFPDSATKCQADSSGGSCPAPVSPTPVSPTPVPAAPSPAPTGSSGVITAADLLASPDLMCKTWGYTAKPWWYVALQGLAMSFLLNCWRHARGEKRQWSADTECKPSCGGLLSFYFGGLLPLLLTLQAVFILAKAAKTVASDTLTLDLGTGWQNYSMAMYAVVVSSTGQAALQGVGFYVGVLVKSARQEAQGENELEIDDILEDRPEFRKYAAAVGVVGEETGEHPALALCRQVAFYLTCVLLLPASLTHCFVVAFIYCWYWFAILMAALIITSGCGEIFVLHLWALFLFPFAFTSAFGIGVYHWQHNPFGVDLHAITVEFNSHSTAAWAHCTAENWHRDFITFVDFIGLFN